MDWYGLNYTKLNKDFNDFDMILKYDSKINVEN